MHQYWLIKTEPHEYSWQQMKKDKTTQWNGVRNYEARKNMKNMQLNDLCFFYHSGEKRIMGLVKVIKTYYPDETDNKFGIVEVEYYKSCVTPLYLNEIKLLPLLQDMLLVKRNRLSIIPVKVEEAYTICKYTGLE